MANPDDGIRDGIRRAFDPGGGGVVNGYHVHPEKRLVVFVQPELPSVVDGTHPNGQRPPGVGYFKCAARRHSAWTSILRLREGWDSADGAQRDPFAMRASQ